MINRFWWAVPTLLTAHGVCLLLTGAHRRKGRSELECADQVVASQAFTQPMSPVSSTLQIEACESLRSDRGRLAIHAVWLLRLRCVACAGQLLTVAFAAIVFGVAL